MQIHELCAECHVTKKAVEYYISEGLLHPGAAQNGYRCFSDEDAAVVKKITLLRKLGMSVADIRAFLSTGDKRSIVEALKDCQKRAMVQARDRLDCLDILLQNRCELEACADSIYSRLGEPAQLIERLRLAFPGDYGLFLSIHFGRFLHIGIDSDEKAAAYRKILDFLDAAPRLELPEDVRVIAENMFEGSAESARLMDNAVLNTIEDYDGFMEKNQEFIKRYLEFRNSEAYLSSPAFKLRQLLLQFMQTSGYYDAFIPNLMILSDSYKAYHDKLTQLNEEVLISYPELSALSPS